MAASRTGVPVDHVHAAIDPSDPRDDAALVALAGITDQLVTHLGLPPPPQENP